ncbi:hypothetical protein KC357_g9045 [Hortaea werneckii]|nr:hypothetical protein KC357_g9045 [Hortaea werneckii]
MLDHADPDAVTDAHSNASPHQLHAAYPPQDQFDQQQAAADYHPRLGYGPGQHQRMGSQSQYGQHQIGSQQRQQQQQQQQQQQGSGAAAAAAGGGGQGPFAGAQAIDPNDPMLDADPFGLSASMHYPTAYTPMDQRR